MSRPRRRERAGDVLLLAGLGHAHLFVLEALARGALPAARVLLVSPPEYAYSGMVPGTLAGCYPPEAARLDPARLARTAGAEWVAGRVRSIDPAARLALLDDGTPLPYRLLSLDVGSEPAGADLPGVAEHAIPLKPVAGALRRLEAVIPAAPARLVVVGGGAAGVETALCLHAALAARSPHHSTLSLIERGTEILDEYPASYRRRAEAILRRRGVEVRTGAAVRTVEAGWVELEGRGPLAYDLLLWATGPAPPPLIRASALPTDAAGWLRVAPTLRVPGHPEIFGAGDCVAIEGFPRVPKAGVYAVRQGPVLARNLTRALRGEPLEEYAPQRHWLSLMNTGDGRALLHWRGVVAHGRAAWWLKDRIDRRFVGRFRA